MKSLQLVLTLLIFASTLSAQSEITIPEQQVPLVSKLSASWCPHCGSWGWDLMEGLIEDNSSVSNLITIHFSGNYKTDAGASMTSNFGAFGQPQFYVNSNHIAVNSSSVNAKRSEIKSAIATDAAVSPTAQSGLMAGTHAGQFNILTNTRFFQEAEGDYYLGLYLLEREFVGNQAGRGSNALHKNLLRMSFTEGAFGEPLANGTIAAGTEVFFQKSVALDNIAQNLSNISVLSIIWKKEGDRYLVVNSNATAEVITGLELMTTGLNQLAAADFKVEIAPNVVSETATLQLELPTARKQFRVELWQLNGQRAAEIFQGALPAGPHNWTISRGDLPAGMYLIRLQDGQRQWSERIVFR